MSDGKLRPLAEGMGPLLAQALGDLAWCEAHGYEADMQAWHEAAGRGQEGPEPCRVDLAGAVIARRLGVRKRETRTPADFPEEVRKRLVALDLLRHGRVEDAMRRAASRGAKVGDRAIPAFCTDPAGWRKALARLAEEMAIAGD